MLKYLPLLALLFYFSSLKAQQSVELISTADSQYYAGNHTDAFSLYKKSFKSKTPVPKWSYYRASKCALVFGKKRVAARYLNHLAELDWANLEYLKSDSLIMEKVPKKKLKRLVERLEDTIQYYETPKEILLNIYELDQQVRRDPSLIKKRFPQTEGLAYRDLLSFVDSINRPQANFVLEKYGWVSDDIVGREANAALFFAYQHSDIASMKKVLPLLKKSVEKGNSDANHFAMMVDRVHLDENGCQVYGTQYVYLDSGEKVLSPICDLKKADTERKVLGIWTLDKHMKRNNLKLDESNL